MRSLLKYLSNKLAVDGLITYKDVRCFFEVFVDIYLETYIFGRKFEWRMNHLWWYLWNAFYWYFSYTTEMASFPHTITE